MAAHLGTAMILFGLLLWLSFKARSEAAVEADRPVRPPVRGPEAVRGDGGGAAALRDRRRRLHGRNRGGGRQRGRPEHRRRPPRLRSPVPDLRRREVPALRQQPADRHPPHPPRLRLRSDPRDRRAALRRLRARLARPPAPAGRAAPARPGPARGTERLARRARGADRRPPHGRDPALGGGGLDRLPARLAPEPRAVAMHGPRGPRHRRRRHERPSPNRPGSASAGAGPAATTSPSRRPTRGPAPCGRRSAWRTTTSR